MKKAKIIYLLLLIATFLACTQDRWEGFVYPNQSNLTSHVYVGEYNNLEDCRDAALAKLEELGALNQGDYECGKNCRSEPGLTVRICEETLN